MSTKKKPPVRPFEVCRWDVEAGAWIRVKRFATKKEAVKYGEWLAKEIGEDYWDDVAVYQGKKCLQVIHIPKTESCHHEADPNSIRMADGMPWIVDVTCKKCGLSGSGRVDPKDIQW